MHDSSHYILWLSEGFCSMSCPSAIKHGCALKDCRNSGDPSLFHHASWQGPKLENLIKSLECQVKVNKNHTAAYYYVTLFLFQALPDLKTSEHSDPSVAKTEKLR